jgi:hypothetical protein
MATPPDFVAGQVLTAAQMNKIGSWLIKTQTIGTTVSSVVVSDAFSADYEAYRIVVTGGAGSTLQDLRMTLGSTATGYYYSFVGTAYNSNTPFGSAAQNAASWVFAGAADTGALSMDVTLHQPFATKITTIRGQYTSVTTTGAAGTFNGYLNDTTSYTAFTITPSTGTMTGGTIYVYGLRD